MSDSDPKRRQAAAWIMLLLVAALVRAVALYAWSGHLTDDRDDYLTVAKQYAAFGFWTPFEGFPSAFRPPLYPLVLSAILRCGAGSMAWGILQGRWERQRWR